MDDDSAAQVRIKAPIRENHPSSLTWSTVMAAAAALSLMLVFGFVSVKRLMAYRGKATIWQDALKHQPDDFLVYNCLGQALLDDERPAEAIDVLRSSVQLKSNYAPAQSNLAEALLRTGRVEEAIEHFRYAIRIRPDFSTAYYNFGNALAMMGRPQEAIEQFQTALQLNRSFPLAHNNLAAALFALGRFDEAIDHFEQTVRLQPNFAHAWANLALASAKANRFDKAIEVGETALSLARAQGLTELVQRLESDLATYRANKR